MMGQLAGKFVHRSANGGRYAGRLSDQRKDSARMQ